MLYKNNWGADVDYQMREDGFIETEHTVREKNMPQLKRLCNNAKDEKEIVCYIYNRFSSDGYTAYDNILKWLEENGIEYSTYWNI